jgi:hypothetical protein
MTAVVSMEAASRASARTHLRTTKETINVVLDAIHFLPYSRDQILPVSGILAETLANGGEPMKRRVEVIARKPSALGHVAGRSEVARDPHELLVVIRGEAVPRAIDIAKVEGSAQTIERTNKKAVDGLLVPSSGFNLRQAAQDFSNGLLGGLSHGILWLSKDHHFIDYGWKPTPLKEICQSSPSGRKLNIFALLFRKMRLQVRGRMGS